MITYVQLNTSIKVGGEVLNNLDVRTGKYDLLLGSGPSGEILGVEVRSPLSDEAILVPWSNVRCLRYKDQESKPAPKKPTPKAKTSAKRKKKVSK